MKIIFNKNKFPFWPLGINQRLFFLNAICHNFKLHPEIYFYDNNNQNRFFDLFEISLPEHYSREKSIVVTNNGTEIQIKDEDILWLNSHDHHRLSYDILGNIGMHMGIFKNTIKLSKVIIDEAQKLYEQLGTPTVGITIRETEKFDSTTTITSALPSRLIYDRLVELNLHKEKILIISDSLLTIDYLKQKGLDVVYYSKYKSKTIFPSHWFSKISRFYPENSGEYNLFNDVEFEMAKDFLLEVAMMTHCSIHHKYSTILSGPTMLINNISTTGPLKDLINVHKDLNERELDIIRYHQHREKILWLTLTTFADSHSEPKY
jgi:hypothetical protein